MPNIKTANRVIAIGSWAVWRSIKGLKRLLSTWPTPT
jgi:hypothetical protein